MEDKQPTLRLHPLPFVAMAVVWSLLIGVVYVKNIDRERDYTEGINLQTARAAFQQVITFRLWNATHGGVYVPVTPDTPPNPYLDVPDRDLTTSDGRTLTKINPAYMTRQASVLSRMSNGVRFHITSLTPINPKNAPYAWEKKWLMDFNAGARERWGFGRRDKTRVFRYMAPLFTKSPCLRCHAIQGYKEGDVRGAISITFPAQTHTTPPLWWPFALALIAGLAAIGAVFVLNLRQVRSQRRHLKRLGQEIQTRFLREQEIASLQAILDQIRDSVFLFDAESLSFLYVNQAAQRQTGHDAEAFAGLSPERLLPSFPVENLRELDHADEDTAASQLTMETTLCCADGENIEVELQAQKVTWAQNRPCYLVIIRDITERNRHLKAQLSMEKRLAEAQRLESIATLAGGITHDFNNLLTIIIGYADLTREIIADNADAARNMETLLHACRQAKNLVKQILSFSRAASTEKKPLMLHLMVKESLKMLKKTLPSSITLREYIDTRDDIILADPVQIQQIVMNLCINAFHAMGENGGTLTVTLQPVEISAKESADLGDLEPGPHVRLDVADTGCGIPEDIIDKIFDPYFTTKEKDKGTGLGLAVVYGIVKDMNGHIAVATSTAGTTFSIFLPTTPAAGGEVQPTAAASGPPPSGHGEHILVVDDNPELVDLLAEMLTSLGYHVTARTSSREALAAFNANPQRFDLVITDQIMPGLTGTQLAAEILKRRRLPIILCTGYSETVNKETFKRYGITAFIMKPVIKEEIAACVHQVLEGDGDRSGQPAAPADP